MTPEKRKEYYQKNKEHLKQQQRKYYKQNYQERKERNRDFRLRRMFGLEVGQYKILLEKQNFCCLICGRSQEELGKKLAVDHCHTTSKIRGLLCLHCNTALGQVQENIEVLQKMIQYIKDHND